MTEQYIPERRKATRRDNEALTQEAIVQAVKLALADHPCRYDLSPQQLDHLIGMVSDVGDGDLRKGVERLRANHQWLRWRTEERRSEEYLNNHELVSAVRRGLGNISTNIGRAVVWALIMGIAILLWVGFKVELFK